MNAEFTRRGVDAVAASADVAPGDLGGFARGLRRWRNLARLSVTMPHKEALAAHVDELIDAAALVDAVNVVRRESDARLVGANTDGAGFVIGLPKLQILRDHAKGGFGANFMIPKGLLPQRVLNPSRS